MNDNLIRKLCESRHRWLFAAIGTTLIALLLLTPLVDEYYAQCNESKDLSAELIEANLTASGLPEREQETKKQLETLAALELRTVDEQSGADFRNQLMALVRDADCQLRRLQFADPELQDWLPGTNPLEATAATEEKQSCRLEKTSVVLSASGTLDGIRKLIEELTGNGKIMHLKLMEILPENRSRSRLTLDLEMWFYTLSQQTTT